MEVKKDLRVSLENKRFLLIEMGFVLSLACVYAAFNFSTRARQMAMLPSGDFGDPLWIEEIPIVLPPPPPAAPPLPALPVLPDPDIVTIVPDDVPVCNDFLPDDLLGSFGPIPVPEKEDPDETIPVFIVETKPSFQGGDAQAFSKWVSARISYPEVCKENGIQGKVMLQFTVEADGAVTHVKVLRGVDPALDGEAVRVVSSSPRWTPGRNRDRAVKVSYTFPVVFQLR